MLSTNVYVGQNKLETDKWQSKTLFLAIFDPRSWIVKSVYDCRLSGVVTKTDLCLLLVQG